MQKFNSINLESKFIKNILQSTYLPTVPIVTDGDFIVSGLEYCYKNHMIRCLTTGVLVGDNFTLDGVTYVDSWDTHGNRAIVSPAACDAAICSVDFICGMGIRTAQYKSIQRLTSHTLMSGLTHKYQSATPKYDAETHRYLGVYLRWYRDTYGIDLLPLYNCFCGESYTLAHIQDNKLVDGYDASKNVSIVPIQLNKQYTVFISSSHKVSICGAFLNHGGRVLHSKTSNIQYKDELLDETVIQLNNSSYSNPITYELYTTNPELLSYSNNFYLIIQTETGQFCPIVVLEGVHSRAPKRLVTSRETYTNNDTIDYSLFNPMMKSSMTALPTTYHIPYSARLMEFLTESVISSAEDIPNNVSRIQAAIGITPYDASLRDVWNDKIRFVAHNEYFKYSDRHYLHSSQLNERHEPNIEVPHNNCVVYGKAPDFIYEMSNNSSANYYRIVKDKSTKETYYEPLLTKPSDWDTNYWKYYRYSDTDGFTPVTATSDNTTQVIGFKNCSPKRTFRNEWDITGYIDKDVENKLFGYRSV